MSTGKNVNSDDACAWKSMSVDQLQVYIIAALNSERANLSPFTKGCRERDASMRLFSIFGIELRAQSAGQRNKARRICISKSA